MTTIQIQKNSKSTIPYVQNEHGDLLMIEPAVQYASRKMGEPYVLKVRDLPIQDKPREKMLSQGLQSLSLPELLSVILMTGTKKEDVLNISSRLIAEYGKNILTSPDKSATDLAKEMDIPLVKACQILAVGEIGRRLFDKNMHGLAVLRTPEDVYEYTKDLHNLPKEQLRGLYLDTHHKVIHDEILSIGTVNASMLHPREVFKPALEYSAAAIILVHNHPSGNSTPSESDCVITDQIVKAGKVLGISVLDHLVVTRSGFSSVPVKYQ